VRTSVSHPLRIDKTPAGDAGGQIGIAFCPGKHGNSNSGFVWRRDLGLDLSVRIARGNARAGSEQCGHESSHCEVDGRQQEIEFARLVVDGLVDSIAFRLAPKR
jgi:hypothetical protein